jgi:hypothetical protein
MMGWCDAGDWTPGSKTHPGLYWRRRSGSYGWLEAAILNPPARFR